MEGDGCDFQLIGAFDIGKGGVGEFESEDWSQAVPSEYYFNFVPSAFWKDFSADRTVILFASLYQILANETVPNKLLV